MKVPSLPFHSLISLLSKFPADDDSKVFWSASLRDMLYGKVASFWSYNSQLISCPLMQTLHMVRFESCMSFPPPNITYTAAVKVLMAQIEENPLSDSTTLMTQVVRSALNCQGVYIDQARYHPY